MQEKKPEKITLKSLDFRLENLGGELKNLDAKFEKKFDVVDKRFNAIDARFNAVDARFDTLEESMRRMGVLMEEMNGKLSLLLEGYMGHDTRIVSLENWREKMRERLG